MSPTGQAAQRTPPAMQGPQHPRFYYNNNYYYYYVMSICAP